MCRDLRGLTNRLSGYGHSNLKLRRYSRITRYWRGVTREESLNPDVRAKGLSYLSCTSVRTPITPYPAYTLTSGKARGVTTCQRSVHLC